MAQRLSTFSDFPVQKSSASADNELFWTEYGVSVMGSHRGRVDVEKIADEIGFPAGVGIVATIGFVVWTDATTHTIRLAALDGSEEVVFFEGISGSVIDNKGRFRCLTDVAVDEAGCMW